MADRKNTQVDPALRGTSKNPGKTPKATGAMSKESFAKAIWQATASPDAKAIGIVGKQECERLGLRPTAKHAVRVKEGGSTFDAQSIIVWMRRVKEGDRAAGKQLIQITATAGATHP